MVLQPAKVMLVDDEPQNLDVVGQMLEDDGFRLSAFPSAEMALAAMAEVVPDIILLDVRMSGMDGYELCRKLKRTDAWKNIPVSAVLLQKHCKKPSSMWLMMNKKKQSMIRKSPVGTFI